MTRLAILVALTILAIFPIPARAALIFSLQPSITANAGSTDNQFDVLLTNTGSSAVTVAAFSFGIVTSDASITFTGASISTVSPYIFAGDSFDGANSFPLNTVPPPPGQTLEASDLSNSGLGDSVGPGDTVGVGRIMFNVANGAASATAPVTFESFPTTSLSDADLNNLAFSSDNGSITTNAMSGVPEPGTGFQVAAALVAFAFIFLRRVW